MNFTKPFLYVLFELHKICHTVEHLHTFWLNFTKPFLPSSPILTCVKYRLLLYRCSINQSLENLPSPSLSFALPLAKLKKFLSIPNWIKTNWIGCLLNNHTEKPLTKSPFWWNSYYSCSKNFAISCWTKSFFSILLVADSNRDVIFPNPIYRKPTYGICS